MVMVNEVTIGASLGGSVAQVKQLGLQRSAAALRSCCVYQMNWVNSFSGSAMMTAP